jgi:glycosyltransferase involved in cell wall biosynthesis
MRIGVMLRAIDEKGGVGVYTRNIVKELIDLDRSNEYLLMYRDPANLGLFAQFPNVREIWVKGTNKAYWDQVAIPAVSWKERTDVIFHPKFTVPLFAHCKTVMTVHGADWLIPEQAKFYTPLDVRYMRVMLPLYIQRSAAVISVSQETTDNFYGMLQLPAGKIQTIYFAPARTFRRIADPQILKKVRDRYHLPERFILTLTKRKGDGRKNFGQVINAYAQYHHQASMPHMLVVGGKDCHLFREEYHMPADGYGRDIVFPGWIDQADMPAVFSLADLYLYPSNLEAFPIPLTEAMACGTPILTSNVNGLLEIAGDAALLVDPSDADAIAQAIDQILSNPALHESLSRKGLERSALFSWDDCAQKTLDLLEKVARS